MQKALESAVTFPSIKIETLQKLLDDCRDDTARDLPQAILQRFRIIDGWLLAVRCKFSKTQDLSRTFLVKDLDLAVAAFPLAIVSMLDLHFQNALQGIREEAIKLKLLEPVVK